MEKIAWLILVQVHQMKEDTISKLMENLKQNQLDMEKRINEKCDPIDPAKYKSVISGFGVMFREQGIRGFFRGWAPTLIGYSAQGAGKYGLYEFFKKYYADIAGPEYAAKYKTLIYLAGSGVLHLLKCLLMLPSVLWKLSKFESRLSRGSPEVCQMGYQSLSNPKALSGCTKGLFLFGDAKFLVNTMMKFATFEKFVELTYKHVIPTPKEQCSTPLQLGVSFACGYEAGVFCAVVSHPADNLVSILNNAKGATVSDAVKNLGVWGLFTRGLPLRIVMIGTLTGSQWGIYDACKVFMGV
ncbi:hypothetical protein ABKV19_021171 [Rosa sericea]